MVNCLGIIKVQQQIYIRNNKGPTTDPWGTPHVTLKKEDLVSPISPAKDV